MCFGSTYLRLQNLDLIVLSITYFNFLTVRVDFMVKLELYFGMGVVLLSLLFWKRYVSWIGILWNRCYVIYSTSSMFSSRKTENHYVNKIGIITHIDVYTVIFRVCINLLVCISHTNYEFDMFPVKAQLFSMPLLQRTTYL